MVVAIGVRTGDAGMVLCWLALGARRVHGLVRCGLVGWDSPAVVDGGAVVAALLLLAGVGVFIFGFGILNGTPADILRPWEAAGWLLLVSACIRLVYGSTTD